MGASEPDVDLRRETATPSLSPSSQARSDVERTGKEGNLSPVFPGNVSSGGLGEDGSAW